MSDTRDSLMRAILVDPADDTVRLIIADHYEENGETERAEFIRVQVEVDPWNRTWPPMTFERKDVLRQRERKLFDRFKTQWFDERAEIYYLPIYYLPHEVEDAKGQYPDLTRAIVRRGFVAAVRCRLADWVGGPCGCENGGVDTGGTTPWGAPISVRCEECKGTGRTTAHGPRIVAEQPVEEVRLSDRRPFSNLKVDGGMEYGFEQHDEGGAPGTGMLPSVIFDGLQGHYRQPNKYRKWWDTKATALSALSFALVQWARREAGLPPIPHPADAREGDETR